MEEESSLGINSQELTAILQALVFEEANRIQEEAEVIFGALQQQATEREEREATQNKLDLISLDQVVELATKHGLDSDIAKTLFRTTVEARNRRERLERTVIEAQEERVASLGIGSHEFRGDWLIEEQLKQILSTSSDVVTRMLS